MSATNNLRATTFRWALSLFDKLIRRNKNPLLSIQPTSPIGEYVQLSSHWTGLVALAEERIEALRPECLAFTGGAYRRLIPGECGGHTQAVIIFTNYKGISTSCQAVDCPLSELNHLYKKLQIDNNFRIKEMG